MKKFKKVFAVLLLMLLIAAPVVTAATQPVTVEAAARTKTKLKKVKGKYYAYENGKKVCNKWRTIKVGKKKYRFYFDKKGRAYQANKAAMGKTGVLVKKIKGKYYGFDYQGHMVKGIRGGSSPAYSMPNLYFFNSKGVYDKKKTAMYRNAAKINSNATQIKKLLGKYKKVSVIGESCFGNGKGSDVVYVYDNIELSVFRPTGKDASAEIVESVSQRY